MALLAVVGGVLAMLGGASPTGLAVVDALYVGLAGAGLSMAASRSRRLPWLVTGLAALWLAPTTLTRVAAIVALAAAIYAVRTQRRRSIGASVGALAAFVFGNLGSGAFLGATTLYAVAGALPVVISGALLMPAHVRRRTGVGAAIWAAAAAVATGAFALSAFLAIDDVSDGVDAANTAFDLAADGDEVAAGLAFDSSSAAFERGRSNVSGFWTYPARLVPFVGHHVRAVQVVAGEGVALTNAGADTARSIDPDDIGLIGGAIDLSLIDELAPVLDRAQRALERAHRRVDAARSPWLLEPLDSRMEELLDELDDARPSARTAALAARELPELLGGDGAVRWLVAIMTPAEARGLGGLLGSWVVIEADSGRLEIVQSGRNEDISAQLVALGATLDAAPQYEARWGEFTPQEHFQDVTLSPDLPFVAAVTTDLFEQATELDIDGALFLDPFAIAGILRLTGPVAAGDLRLDQQSVLPFLLEDQYVRFAGDEAGRVATQTALVTAAFTALTTQTPVGPRTIVDVLGPLVEQDRIGAWWQRRGGADELFDAAGLDGEFPDRGEGDLVGIVHQNAGQNKLDVHLRRELDYQLRVDDGRVDATVTVTLHNDLDDLELPLSMIGSNDQGLPVGTNRVRLALHTPHDLRAITVDGEPVPVNRQDAFGHSALTVVVDVAPGGTQTVQFILDGAQPWNADSYRLTLPFQPLVNPDIVSLDIEIDGDPIGSPQPFSLTQDRVVGLPE